MPNDAPALAAVPATTARHRARYDADVVISGGPNQEMDRFPKAVLCLIILSIIIPFALRLLLRGFPPDHDAQVSHAIQDGPPTGYRAHLGAYPAPHLILPIHTD